MTKSLMRLISSLVIKISQIPEELCAPSLELSNKTNITEIGQEVKENDQVTTNETN